MKHHRHLNSNPVVRNTLSIFVWQRIQKVGKNYSYLKSCNKFWVLHKFVWQDVPSKPCSSHSRISAISYLKWKEIHLQEMKLFFKTVICVCTYLLKSWTNPFHSPSSQRQKFVVHLPNITHSFPMHYPAGRAYRWNKQLKVSVTLQYRLQFYSRF